ncbi:MAG: dihydrodipicolinate synthase family protein [Fimbriimonadaceae bacterium]|nr:dihydrodipicolinate synthase family protein [Fimbriimonadaceae bacterium]
MTFRLHGLVAATHTPFDAHGELNLDAVDAQAAHLAKNGVTTVFIGGSTGESHSLSLDERLAMTEKWTTIACEHGLGVVVHVGSNCLRDACALAAHAASRGVAAVSALAPMYFKPKSLDVLVDCCAEVARSAPQVPFYFYDIPALTGVNFSMPEFLARAPEKIPNLAGIKFTNPDLMAYQNCLRTPFDIPWGVDEYMLGALALGAKGAVGSSFNFAAPVYHRLVSAFEAGDMGTARQEQLKSVRLVELLASYGYMAAAKATMGFLGVDVGAPRLPNAGLTADSVARLKSDLDALGFFDWVATR